MNPEHINRYLVKTKIRKNSTQQIFRFENNIGVYVTIANEELIQKSAVTEISIVRINNDKTTTFIEYIIESLNPKEVISILENVKRWDSSQMIDHENA